jgi:Mrp family chromosome partitioning ATPase
LRTRGNVEGASGLTVVAELPEERIKSKRHELPIVDQPGGALAESIRGLRTTLRYLGATDPIRSLVVTSPQSGDGKTVTAANLAASFAASGVTTVLVSGDLRRPGLDELFGLEGMVGLSDVLVGGWPGPPSGGDGMSATTFVNGPSGGLAVLAPEVSAAHMEPLLRPAALANLRVLPAGRVPPNPSELLSSERAAKVFAALGELAEMVIVDSPPTVVADSAVLAGLVDSAVLVVALDRTRRGALRQSRQTLQSANTRLVGIVLNRVRSSTEGYSGYYSARAPSRSS